MENTALNVKVLDLDKPNLNGRTYPTREVEKTIRQTSVPFMGTLGMPDGDKISLTKVSHAVEELRIEDGALMAKITLLQTPAGQMLSQLLDECEFRAAGTGDIDENGVVSNWKMTTVSAVDRDTAA